MRADDELACWDMLIISKQNKKRELERDLPRLAATYSKCSITYADFNQLVMEKPVFLYLFSPVTSMKTGKC